MAVAVTVAVNFVVDVTVSAGGVYDLFVLVLVD